MEIIYRVNGENYTNKEEAEKAEAKFNKEQEEKKKFSEEREKRAGEVQKAYVEYVRLKNAYDKDYGKTINMNDLIMDFFN